MPSDDTPLVIKSSNELPASDKRRIVIIGYVSRVPGGPDIQVESSHSMPEFRYNPCQKKSVGSPSPCTLLQKRTHKNPAEIQRDHGN